MGAKIRLLVIAVLLVTLGVFPGYARGEGRVGVTIDTFAESGAVPAPAGQGDVTDTDEDACSDCARDPLAPDAPQSEFPQLLAPTWDSASGEGRLGVAIYYSPSCGHCTVFRGEVWPAIADEYGERLDVAWVDVSAAEGMAALEATEARLGTRAPDIPVVVVGADAYLYDLDMGRLGDAVRAAIEEGLESGTASSGEVGESAEPGGAPAPAAGNEAIHVAYVEKDGCSDCARARLVLDALQPEYPQMVVTTWNSVRDAALVEAAGQHLGLPDADRLLAPSVYLGSRALLGDDITLANVRTFLQEYAPSGAPAFWEGLEVTAGRESIAARFARMGPLAVVAAALLDGINPCAFATILFFVSYLAVSRRPRRDLLFIGLTFTAGVFVTYLLVGLGAMRLLQLASAIRIVGPILYGAMAVGCLVLAGLSLYDYILARRGQLKDMRLNLPEGLRERIRGRIRAASGAYVGAAFGSGLIVSLLELACTGQVYLPTISFMVTVPEMRGSAIAYLLLYNVAFVVPLVVVLLLAVYGVSAMRVQDWFVRNAARTKLLMSALFAVLAGLLATQAVGL